MPKLKIADVEPGMILAEDLQTKEGRMLLPSGSTVTEAHLRTCRVWGIETATIIGDEPEVEQQLTLKDLDTRVLDACKALADKRFALNPPRHPAVKRLIELFILRRARGLTPQNAAVTLLPELEIAALLVPTEKHRLQPEQVVEEELELASLPDIFNQIADAIRNPRSSAAFVAEVISKDVAVSAKLLKMVNTPFFGFPSRIDTLSRAVTVVGTDQLANLALGISIITAFENVPEDYFTLKDFWLHSIACGIIARLMAAELGIEEDERFFVAGLLHDIGRMVVLKNRAEAAVKVLGPAQTSTLGLLDIEHQVWACDHADIGGEILKAWRLPPFLHIMASDHHRPMDSEMDEVAPILHVADFMTHALGIGSSGTHLVPELDTVAWNKTGLSKDSLVTIARQAEIQSQEVMKAFFD